MKTKFVILAFLFAGFFSLTSCEDTNNENEENEPQPVYELSLHQLSLKIQIDSLQTRLENLEEGTNEYASTQDRLDFSEDFLAHVEDQFIGIEPPPEPLPLPGPVPCPPEGNCGIPLNQIQAILASTKLEDFGFVFQNLDGQEVSNFVEPEPVSNNSGFLSYPVQINRDIAEEDMVLEITKFSDFTEQMVTYQLQVELSAG